MKKIIIPAFVALVFFSCTKSNDITTPLQTPVVTPIKTPEQPAISKPTASFKITNLNEVGNIFELRTLAIQNTSTNADSYSWDFGQSANYSDGVVDYPIQFSDKAEPVNIYIVPCMQTVTITLTAKNKAGDVSTTSQSFYIYCFRGVGGRHPLVHKLY